MDERRGSSPNSERPCPGQLRCPIGARSDERRDLHGVLENFDRFRSQVETAASRKFDRYGFDAQNYEGMPAIRLTTVDLITRPVDGLYLFIEYLSSKSFDTLAVSAVTLRGENRTRRAAFQARHRSCIRLSGPGGLMFTPGAPDLAALLRPAISTGTPRRNRGIETFGRRPSPAPTAWVCCT